MAGFASVTTMDPSSPYCKCRGSGVAAIESVAAKIRPYFAQMSAGHLLPG
jgi:hypothetical protein